MGGSQVQGLLYILVAPPIHHSAALSDPNPFVWTLVSRQIPPLPRASPTYDCKYTDRGMRKYCMHPTPHIEPSCVNIVEQDLYCGVCVNIGNVSKSAAISDALGGPNSQLPKWRTAQIQVHVGISQKYIYPAPSYQFCLIVTRGAFFVWRAPILTCMLKFLEPSREMPEIRVSEGKNTVLEFP